MKKIALYMLTVLLLCGSVIGCTSTSTASTLTLGTSADYPPFEFIVLNASGEREYAGIDIAVAEAIAADAGKTLNVMNMDFDSLIASLQKGDIDFVIAAMEETSPCSLAPCLERSEWRRPRCRSGSCSSPPL